MPANSAMLTTPLMFLAETWPVTMRQSICTVSADISQVFLTPLSSASMGPERWVSTRPGGQTGAPSLSVIPSRPTGLPSSIARGHSRYDTQSLAAALDFDRDVAICRAPDDGTEGARIGDGLPIHGEQPVARLQSGAPAGAARRYRADARVSAFQVARSKPNPGSNLPGSVSAAPIGRNA